MKRFCLVGNPNCGKTTLFNSLTGSKAHVGNWPGVTVEKKEGNYKVNNETVSVVDLPGVYSLSPYTSEEVITRNYILEEKPDCIINIVDVTNLERNLYLTTQIMEMEVPIIIALNMIDALEKKGDTIDCEALERAIGLPVVMISALKETHLDFLMERAYETSMKKRSATCIFEDNNLRHLLDDIFIAFKGKGVSSPLFHTIKLIERDEVEVNDHPDLVKMVEEYKEVMKNENHDYEAIIADLRYKYITSHYSKYLTKNPLNHDNSKSDKIDRVLTHKIWGIPIFLGILFLIFHFTFSEDLLFLNALGIVDVTSFKGTAFEGVLANGGINSLGVILFNLVEVGCQGINDGFANLFSGLSDWTVGLLMDGVLGGLLAIMSFVPQILLLFLFFQILEDSGYMARVAFILDRIFRKFGLSGRAFMPMIMGFGCSVPAMINTRTLSSDKEKIATIRVIPFFSCGAKLPILTAIAGAISMIFGIGNADFITYGMYLLGIISAIFAVLMMNKTVLKGDITPFIMELPNYHLPKVQSLMIHLWEKLKHFIVKAFTIVLASTIIIWVISHFSWNWKYLDDSQMNHSILASFGQLLAPIFIPLGFGANLGKYGFVFVVAIISGLIAKENVIATLGTLTACVIGSANADINSLIVATNITVPALIAFIAFNMLSIPCFAACATAKAELPKGKFFGSVIFWLVFSYLISMAIYVIGTWWWMVFVYLVIVALFIVFLLKGAQYVFNRNNDSISNN